MKIFGLTVALSLAAAGAARAQALPEARTSVGLAVGPAFTTSWFTVEGEGYRPGASAVVALVARQRLGPRFALRGHAAFTHTGLLRGEGVEAGSAGINTWFYDASAEYRPLARQTAPALARAYLFLGAGGVTTNVPGKGPDIAREACLTRYALRHACVLYHPATRLAATAGAGSDFARLGDHPSAFGEYSVHGYRAPSLKVEAPAEKAFTLTHRLSVGLRARVR